MKINNKQSIKMKKTYVIPQLETVVFSSENQVLCSSTTGSGSAYADNFIKNDLTGDSDFWN